MDEEQHEPIPVAIYARVSPTTHEKTENDIHSSLEESIKICKRDAEYEGNNVVAIYYDEYKSGKSAKLMTDFNHMLEDARNKVNTATKGGDGKTPWKRIYCRRVNRFGRNRADMLTAEIELTKLDITLKFVEMGIDTGKQLGKSLMGILAELAEADRDEILENTKRGRDLAKVKGTKSGKPFGHPRKEFDVNSIRTLRMLPIKERPTWETLERDYKVSRTVMLKRLFDAGFWDKENRRII